MAKQAYLDFDIILEKLGEKYQARVESPAGEASHLFELPFSKEKLENFILKIGRTRQGFRRLDSPQMQAAKEFGKQLFEGVFDEDMYTCLAVSLNQAKHEGKGIRLRLHINAPELHDVPWEYLYNRRLNRFFSLSTETPIIRYLEVAEPSRPLTVNPPLKILVMISNPSEYPRLDVEGEWNRLKEALRPMEQRGLVSVEQLAPATLASLQNRLRRGDCHIFHFIGHGAFDETADDGILLFEDNNGRGRKLSGQYLGTLLYDHHALRLVVLNACEGARTAISDPFAGVAQSLLQQQIPAVIAMQFEITDQAALIFSREFYSAIADGYPVDSALAEARKAIYASENDVEWGTPVYLTRASDGRIFEIEAQPEPLPRFDLTPEKDLEYEKRLTQRYDEGLSAFWLQDWTRARRIFQEVVDLRPNYSDAAEKLAHVEQQLEWAESYSQVTTQIRLENWPEALALLEKLADAAPNYRDTSSLLENIRQRVRLDELYAEATRLHHAEQWQAVVNVFERMKEIQVDYTDPKALLSTANTALEKLKQEERLEKLYREALRAMNENRWGHAQRLLRQITAVAPGYRETEQLIKRAELEDLYAEATQQFEAKQWQRVLETLEHLKELKTDFPDPKNLLESARIKLEQEARLSKWYQAALTEMKAKHWQEARQHFYKVQAEMPDYQDTAQRLKQVEREIAREQQKKKQQITVNMAKPKLKWSPKLTKWSILGLILGLLGALILYGTRFINERLPNSLVDDFGVTMRLIPAGSFQMGSETGDKNEKPVHMVNLDNYYIDQYEVTNAQYVACVEAGTCQMRNSSEMDDTEFAQYPVRGISWKDAQTYCEWRETSLPTEAEWEKAARGGLEGMDYPWGSEAPVCELGAQNGAQYNECSGNTVEVGSFAPNGFGLFDMAGNVSEWVADRYSNDYYSSSPTNNPTGPETGVSRVVRGGSWSHADKNLNVADRELYITEGNTPYLGFRCARARLPSLDTNTNSTPETPSPTIEEGTLTEVLLPTIRPTNTPVPPANLLLNASFEQGNPALTWRWINDTFCNRWVYEDSSYAFDGDFYLATNRNNYSACNSFYQDITRIPNIQETYIFRIKVRVPEGQTRQGQVVIWALGGVQEKGTKEFTLDNNTTWVEVETSLTVQRNDHTAIRAEIYLDSLDGTDYYFDDAYLYIEEGLPSSLIDKYAATMRLIPAGSFQMGSENGDIDAKPVHIVYLDDFYMDQYEVTNKLYNACVYVGVCAEQDTFGTNNDPRFTQYPVEHVTWHNAQTFCEWRGARLPTEAEWEKAARGGLEGMDYPWGNELPICEVGAMNGAQSGECPSKSGWDEAIRVGSYAPNGYGLYDMAGNVWEWVADLYEYFYYGRSPDENPLGPEDGSQGIVRGGSFAGDVYLITHLRVFMRNPLIPTTSINDVGFRCAYSP